MDEELKSLVIAAIGGSPGVRITELTERIAESRPGEARAHVVAQAKAAALSLVDEGTVVVDYRYGLRLGGIRTNKS